MEKTTSKSTWEIPRPLLVVASVIIATASTTYSVLEKLVVAPYRYENENLKAKTEDLNYLVGEQKDVIEKQAATIEQLRKTALTKDGTNHTNTVRRRKTQVAAALESLVRTGNRIADMQIGDDTKYTQFTNWRNEGMALLADVDKTTNSNFSATFADLTSILPAQYQEVSAKTTDGIAVLTVAKGKILQ